MAERTSSSYPLAACAAALVAFLAGLALGARGPASWAAVAPAMPAPSPAAEPDLRAPRRSAPTPPTATRSPLGTLAAGALAAATANPARGFEDERTVAVLSTRLWIALGRPEEAARTFLSAPAARSEDHAELALTLEEHGRSDLAIEVVSARFDLDPQSEECFALLLRLAPERALRAVDSWRARLPLAFSADYDLDALRARALCSLGREREAAALARRLEEFVDWSAHRSCLHVRAASWEWEAAAAAWPARTEELLRSLLTRGGRPDTTSLLRLGRLLERAGRTAELGELFGRFEGRATDDGHLALTLAQLEPERGWRLVGEVCAETPWEAELVLPLARHLRASGRTEEAAELLTRLIGECWDDADLLAEVSTVAPSLLAGLVEARSRELAAARPDEFEGSEALDEALGDLADVQWRLGRHSAAIASWRRARAIDPADLEWFEALRRAEVGLNPLCW